MSSIWRSQLALATILFLSTNANAYEPRLDRLAPQGGQRGKEVAVELFGPRLGIDTQEVLLYEPGLVVRSLDRVDNNRVKVLLSILPECELGRHALRLRTATGLSNLRTFHVGALSEATEAEPNSDLHAAQQVPFGVTINGGVEPEDVDHYRFDASEGDRISVEIEGLRMGRTFFDPLIELLSESGEVLARCDDAPAAHQDAFLSILAPASGRYVVRVREAAYRGDSASTYRLHIGKFPRPAAVFPPAGARRQEVSLAWIGDARGEHSQTLKLPGEGDNYRVWAEDPHGTAPSALDIQLLDSPPTLESEPNNDRERATTVAALGYVSGRIDKPRDLDHYGFSAKKGEVFDIRSHARRLRSPLDAVLRVYDKSGRQRGANDDDRGNPDSYLRFTAPDDGQYTLRVEDRLNRGGPQYTYLIEVSPPKPYVEVAIDERRRYEATVIEAPRGGATAVMLTVNRRDVSSREDLLLSFKGLPVGVAAEAFPLPGNYNRVPVVFTASAAAPLAGALCPPVATLAESSQELATTLKQETLFARGRNNRPMWSHFAQRAPVAVTEPLPFRLRLVEGSSPLIQGGVKELKVIAERDQGFQESIRVYTLYNPPGVSSNRSRSIVKGKNEAIIPCTANGNARPGEWPMTVVGELNSGGRVYACTPFSQLTVAEPYFDMKVPTVTASQGDMVELTIELNHRRAFQGEAELKLVRLPRGVAAERVKVTKDASSATFQLSIAADAKPGRQRGLGCEARLSVDGEPVVYTQGYSEVRIDPRRTTPVAANETNKNGGRS